MSSNSMIWILLAVGAVAVALLLLGSTPDSAVPAETIASTPTTPSSPTTEAAVSIASSAALPVADAGADRTVYEREDVRLDGRGYDPSGGRVITHWTAENGLGYFEDPYDPKTIFTAPSACDCDDDVMLVLTVTNASGVSVSDRICLSIRDPIACPIETTEMSGTFVVIPTSDVCDPVKPTCPPVPSQACESPCVSEAPASARVRKSRYRAPAPTEMTAASCTSRLGRSDPNRPTRETPPRRGSIGTSRRG